MTAPPPSSGSPPLPPDLSSPFAQVGGRDVVERLAARFYEIMERDEPALTAVHRQDPAGGISAEVKQRFALFLVGWLGGPQEYIAQHGHPRLRMRHGRVAIDESLRDAWVRCMNKAMDDCQISGDPRRFLDQRFAEVADFLRNTETR
ncbi:MAG TPA: group II truncated hemoglobin [Polyangia bacterium]